MRTKFLLSFFALAIFGAAPVLADRMSGNSREFLNRNSSQDSFNDRNFVTGNETIFAQRLSSFDEHAKLSIQPEFFRLDRDKADSEDHSIAKSLKHGDPFRKGSERDRGKHKPISTGVGFPSPTVDVPEPASFTLLLLGLGVLGIFLCRRTSL